MSQRVVESDEVGSLESETMECGRGSRETRTQNCQRWRGPSAVVGGGPILISVGGPYQRAHDSLTEVEIWSLAPDGCLVHGRTCRLTVSRNVGLNWTSSCLRGNEYERKKWSHCLGRCFVFGVPRIYASRLSRLVLQGVEAGSNHLHRSPAIRERRRKWSSVPGV
jgi:hypothetical protein